jgi:glycosyltransferase involved in cell wall biosynthesis
VTRPLRVAMIGSRGVPARYGGVETAVEELSASLVERGLDVTVFCRADPNHPAPAVHRGIRCRYVPTIEGKHSGTFVHAAACTLRTAGRSFDLVHFHAMGPTLFAPLPRWIGRRPVVATVQGRDDQRAKWGLVAKTVLGLAARTSAHVPHETIVVSRQLQDEFRRDFGQDTTYIPNGIAPSPLVPDPDRVPAQFGLVPGRYLLVVGRVVPEKAFDVLVRAYRDVPGDVPLVVVGPAEPSPFADSVRELAAGDPRVRMLGPVYGDDMKALWQGALAFVQPSHLEGLPLVLLEAASHGLPVVVSDIGPHVEVVGAASRPGRRVFPRGDVAALTAALTDLLAAPEADRAAAPDLRTAVLRDYSWQSVTDATLEVYERAQHRLRRLR